MYSLNQYIIQWPYSKKLLKIQRKKGEKGSITHLHTVNYKITAFIESDITEDLPLITLREDHPETFYPLSLREEATYLITALVPKNIVSRSDFQGPFQDMYVNKHVNFFPKSYWKEKVIDNEVYIEIVGELFTKNFVGFLDLSLGKREEFFCEVAARKITYESDYRSLLNEIAKESSNLLMQFSGLSRLNIANNKMSSENFSQIIQLRSIMKDLPTAFDTILFKLHNKLNSISTTEPIGGGRKPDTNLMIFNLQILDLQPEGILKKKFNGYTPGKLITKVQNETYDTPENRYIKSFLEELHYIVHSLKKSIDQTIMDNENRKIFLLYALEVDQWLTIIEDYLNSSVFRQVGRMEFFPSNSQVLQNRAGYQDVLILDQRLQSGLQLSWSPLEAVTNDIYSKPVYDLYEIWCFFKIRNILRDIFSAEIEHINLWVEENGSVSFNLKKGLLSGLVFQKKNFKITFFYNKEFSRQTKSGYSYSLKFKPDFTLHFNELSNGNSFYIHFDAKYKLDKIDDMETDLKMSKKEDIVKMHAYKDGIIDTLGSYVLYPGNQFKNYRETEHIIPSIGAIPLVPSDSETEVRLKSFIEDIFMCVQI
ncbi:DUF2357 domain-containing protein [Bacillus sp. ISL-41]|uniref:DUF2357 domain-containing protein n=1 Tax=Bacillus sp. ISL-41 TaxID=2819127 RepID=UPI001BED2FEF|nr:DUF2357 domain-containing protein [Bacillus sp. ISL-41]MBT2641916.1 DUF2357 domain-containing protein [Bacillus sp. ISL-41]